MQPADTQDRAGCERNGRGGFRVDFDHKLLTLKQRLGVPVGNWLTAQQGMRLLLTADATSLRGKRDYATLAILLSCGPRRAELTALRVEDIQRSEEHWVIAGQLRTGTPDAPSPTATRTPSFASEGSNR